MAPFFGHSCRFNSPTNQRRLFCILRSWITYSCCSASAASSSVSSLGQHLRGVTGKGFRQPRESSSTPSPPRHEQARIPITIPKFMISERRKCRNLIILPLMRHALQCLLIPSTLLCFQSAPHLGFRVNMYANMRKYLTELRRKSAHLALRYWHPPSKQISTAPNLDAG